MAKITIDIAENRVTVTSFEGDGSERTILSTEWDQRTVQQVCALVAHQVGDELARHLEELAPRG